MSTAIDDKLRVFPGTASPKLTEQICHHLHTKPGRCEARIYPEGNTLVRVLENVRGKDVFVVQTLSWPVNDNFVELLFWIDAFKRASAAQVTAVVPFFSYAKGDKKDEPRVSIRARACADCLEAVGVDRVLTMDLHAAQIQGFFRVPVDHLYALPSFVEYFKPKIRDPDQWVIVAPDAGFAKHARNYARALGTALAIVDKSRGAEDERAAALDLIGHVKGKHALIVDDVIFAGTTIVAASDRLLEEGALQVHAAVSHGVLSEGAAELIDRSRLTEVIITDTIEYRFQPLPQKVKVISCAGLVARAIRNIFERTSISQLFKF
jgi:ribose-phosphate pyrophosphokinase